MPVTSLETGESDGVKSMNEYTKQGDDFLKETETTLEVIEAVPQKSPLWCKDGEKHGIQYVVTLKNARYSYTFDFWNSIRDAEMLEIAKDIARRGNYAKTSPYFFKLKDFLESEGYPIGMSAIGVRLLEKVKEAIKPKAYDVLACLDVLYSDTFEDFCGNFGYDVDSINAEKTYRAVQEQDRALRRLFTLEQLEKLQEIS